MKILLSVEKQHQDKKRKKNMKIPSLEKEEKQGNWRSFSSFFIELTKLKKR